VDVGEGGERVKDEGEEGIPSIGEREGGEGGEEFSGIEEGEGGEKEEGGGRFPRENTSLGGDEGEDD